MKSTDSTFRNHLDGDVTALCTCWEITRKDGVVLRFTDSDEDVTHEGQAYQSIGAYSRSAIESTSSLSVDNLEVTGMATELALPVEELRAGAYDHAEVLVFMTSWMGGVAGKLKLRRGFFGEVRVLPNGTFTVELRGLLQRLAHTYTDVFSATCRHDLGDDGCGVDLSHPFSAEGAHIPVPFLDPDFEEVGQVGMGASHTWYNPINTEDLIDAGATYSGSFAAHGSTEGGYLVQDVSLAEMGDEFLSHVDTRQVTLNAYGWRRDDGDQGRIRYQFLGHNMKSLKIGAGYTTYNNGGLSIAEVRIPGDFTIETWVRFNNPGDFYSRSVLLSGGPHNDERVLRYNPYERNLSYWVETGGQAIDMFEYPWDPEYHTWYHVALTREGDVFRIYLDGKLVGEETITWHGDLVIDEIGAQINYPTTDADWDEVRIWNVCRTQAEINEFRWEDLQEGNPQLERYYPFDGDVDDYGINDTGPLSGGSGFYTGYLPVASSYRGTETAVDTGFADVGTDWTLVSAEDMPLPPHARYIRVIFDHFGVAGTPQGTRLDSLFGWFKDLSNTVSMPNFNVGDNDNVWTRAGMVTTGGSARIFRANIDEPRASMDGWFQGGLVTFYSGKNAGSSMEVKRWTADGGQIELFLSLPYEVEQGDLFTIYPGCDKSRVACRALFNNMLNFFGTPDVPGEDELFRYPDAK